MPRHAFLLVILCLLATPVQAVPELQHWRTDNGAKVLFIEAPELAMVDIRVVFSAGSARDEALPGLARMTNNLLNEGAGELDADAIASRFEAVGAEYSAGSKRDMAWASLRTLAEPDWLEQAVDTFATVLGQPTFPSGDLERIRKQTLVQLREEAQDPGTVASKAFYRAVYGDHPYASPPVGTEASVKRIPRGDIMDFYERYYVARNAVVAIVGDLERDEAEVLAARVTAGLEPGRAPAPLPEVTALDEPRTVRLPFASDQAHVYMGQVGVRRGSDHYFPAYIGNHILGGGGFTSRLVKAVRIERGLSYSVYSYFLPMDVRGPFVIGLQTRKDQAEQAVDVVRREVEGFLEAGPTDQEMADAKANITGSFPIQVASNSDLVQYAGMIGFYDLALDYLQTFTERIEAVDQSQVSRVMRKRLDPDQMVTVIVGGEAQEGSSE